MFTNSGKMNSQPNNVKYVKIVKVLRRPRSQQRLPTSVQAVQQVKHPVIIHAESLASPAPPVTTTPTNVSLTHHLTQTQITKGTIQEMRENDILWNPQNPHYDTEKRSKQLDVSAKKIGITVEKLASTIEQIKHKHSAIVRIQQLKTIECNPLDWMWYDDCSFLREEDTEKVTKDYNRIAPPAPQCPESSTRTTTEVYLVDPTPSGITIKTEDDPLQIFQDWDPIQISSASSRTPFKAKTAKKSRIKKKFLIDAICSSVTFYLTNANLSEDELVSFHGELIKYMHSYFSKKRTKQ